MTQNFAEILLLVPVAFCAGFIMFVAGVVQGIMNDVDEATFKRLLTKLVKHAVTSPYAIIVSSVTFVGMFPYWYFYGFGNWWFTAGLIMNVVTSSVSKYTTLPIYSRVTGRKFPAYKKYPEIESGETAKLKKEREKLQTANIIRATLSFVTVALMVIGLF